MKKSTITLAILATVFTGTTLAAKGDICTNCPDLDKIKNRADYDYSTYYATADAAIGGDAATFRNAIITDISAGQKQLSYSEVWTALTHTDEDPNNSSNVILLYKANSIPKNHNASGVNNNDYWNREHVWAKSHGFPKESQQGYTDIHHLRPSDSSMNSTRGNKGFDNGGNPVSEAPENSTTTVSWEPRDAVKGDVARMMFYMDVRYDVGTAVTMPDLILVDKVETPTSGLEDGIGQHGKLCTLIEWNYLDPVDAFELERNNEIFELQGNRNPFIDNPEWVDLIYKDSCVIPLNVSIANVADTVEGTDVTLAATTNGSGATYVWEQLTGSPVTIADPTVASFTFTAPDVADEKKEAFEFKVTVTDDQKATAFATVSFDVTDVNYDPTVDVTIADIADTIEGNAVSLKATSAAEGVRYLWTQVSGSPVTIVNPNKATLNFTAPQVSGSEELTFKVTATDKNNLQGTDTVTFKVSDRAVPSTGDSGGSFGIFGILSLLGLGFLRRKSK